MTIEGPPLSALGNCIIEVFGPDVGSAVWDSALWDASSWARVDWRDVTPQSMTMTLTWGADDPTGVLTVPAAGRWQIKTYDPERKLDPSNGNSPLSTSSRPGRPIRISYRRPLTGQLITIRQGLIDEIEYDMITQQGTLRGTDLVQLMVGAKLLEGQQLDLNIPGTLRARSKYLIAKAGLSKLVTVEGEADYHRVIQESNPYAWWPFDEKVIGSVTDHQGIAPGNIVGAVTVGVPGLAQGSGTAYQFAGGHVEVVSPVVLGAQWTLECVVRIPVLPAAAEFVLFDKNNANAPKIRVWIDGTIQVTKGGATLACQSTVPITADIGNLVTVTYASPTDIHIYINGVDVTGPVTATTFNPLPGTPLRMGVGSGFMDEPALWMRALGPVEIALHQSYGFDGIGLYDPPVGPVIDKEASVWSHILTGAFDALYACWLDRLGVLRFRDFGQPEDSGLQIGGVDGIAIDTMTTQGSLQGVFTVIIGYDMTAPTVAITKRDAAKADIYGDIVLRREQPVPDAQAWTDSVLADRAGAGLQYSPGTLRIQTEEQLLSLIDLGMVDIAHLVVESRTPQINVPSRLLGMTIEADTSVGWTAKLLTYIPANEWESGGEPEPPIPPEPPVTQQVVRTYAATKDSRLAHSGSLDAGNGLDDRIFVGYTSGYRNRMVVDFADIPFGDVVEVVKCELLLTTSDEQCGSMGSAPKVTVSRITGSWSEGSYDVNCGFATSNSVKYPGPAVTSSGSVSKAVSAAENAAVTIDITAIARSWFAGSAQQGVMIKSAGEDTAKYSTEFWTRHQGTTGRRPSLRLTVKVAA